MNQLEEVKRGEEAERLMENPLLKEAFELVEGGILSAMKDSPLGDEKTHNKLVMAYQILGQVKKSIKTTMETGKLARLQMEKESNMQKLKRAAGFR